MPATTGAPARLLLQSARGPRGIDAYIGIENPEELHFYARGLTMADFGALYGREITPLDVLITRMPPDLLNPNYWEPLTKEGENTVREKMSGIVTREAEGSTHLWRADRVAPGRLLRDGLEIPVDLVEGYAFRASGDALLRLAEAWNGRDRFEWAGLTAGALGESSFAAVHNDLTRMRRSLPAEQFLFAGLDDEQARVVFARPAHLNRAVDALIRGFVAASSPAHLAPLNARVCDQIARIADGVGLTARAGADLVDKGRTVEINCSLGQTPWGVAVRPGQDPPAGDERALIYYDRTSGLWAVSA